MALGGGLLGVQRAWSSLQFSSYEKVRASHQSSDLILLDQSGQVLQQWRQNNKMRSFPWVRLQELSPVLVRAFLKSEDKNFYEHSGVDFPALGASLYQRTWLRSPRGGSTLSMQLVKLISSRPQAYSGWSGKLLQILAALKIETRWSKDQILEAYLNLVPLRGEYRGVASSTWNLFAKSPSALTQQEATLLAVLARSPNASWASWERRACWQEESLCSDFKQILRDLSFKENQAPLQSEALHVAQRLGRSGRVGELKTTLHRDLQLFAQELLSSQVRQLENQNVHDAAMIVVENRTGHVWAYVGGSGLNSNARYVDGVQALRQAGSTLKPFLYAAAFEKNILHANSWIEDSAVDIVFDRGVYKPRNHDHQFYGWVRVKTALASSLNVPAVKVFRLLNDSSFWSKLSQLHFRNLEDPDHYGPGLALGVADVTLEDLTQAYRTLAQGGKYSPLKFEYDGSAPTEEVVYSEESAREVTQILSEGENRALGFGLESSLSVPGAAVKTGTSKDMRDNWCVGFNSRFTVGVWVGNFSGEPMWNVMGVSGAAPVWKKMMERLQELYPAETLPAEQGTQITQADQPEKYPAARILYPQDGLVLALDPAIPAQNQKMPLVADARKKSGLMWKVNGKKLFAGRRDPLWTPERGVHRFELYEGTQLRGSAKVIVR